MANMGMLLVAVLAVFATKLPAHANGEQEAQPAPKSSSGRAERGMGGNYIAVSGAKKVPAPPPVPAWYECIHIFQPMTLQCGADLLYIISHPDPAKRKRGLGRECCKLFGVANDSCIRQFIKALYGTNQWPELDLLIHFLKNGCRLSA